MRCMLIGNYGMNNLGDEALKEFFLSEFSDIEWLVVSSSPAKGEYARVPSGLRSFCSFKWIRTIRALRTCEYMVFGGGSLFTDVESVRACIIWYVHALVARLCGVKIYMAFQGVGPFRTTLGRRLARTVCRWSVGISVRDAASYDRVESWKLNKKIVQSYDPVLSTIHTQNVDRSKKILTIIPRKNSDSIFQDVVASHITKEQWDAIDILSLEPESVEEQKTCSRVQKGIDQPSKIVPIRTLDQLAEHIAVSTFVVTQRFHGAIAALALAVPFMAVHQGEGDKLYEIEKLHRIDGIEILQARVKSGVDSMRELLLRQQHHNAILSL